MAPCGSRIPKLRDGTGCGEAGRHANTLRPLWDCAFSAFLIAANRSCLRRALGGAGLTAVQISNLPRG